MITTSLEQSRRRTWWRPTRFMSRRKARAGWLGRLKGLLLPAVAVGIWELSARAAAASSFIPSPSEVLGATYAWMFGGGSAFSGPYNGTWLSHTYASSGRVLAGFAVAVVLGVIIGMLIGHYRLFDKLVEPTIQVFRPIPTVAFVPFSVIIFGIGSASAVFLIALAAFFPIVVNTIAGVKSVPVSLLRAAQMLGTPKARIMPLVVFPAALPSIFTGLRVGLGLSWVLVVTSEMLAVKGGLGFVLWDAYAYLRMDLIVSAMLSIGVLGFLSDRLLLLGGKVVLRWHEGD